MSEPPEALLARLDERTKDIIEKVNSIKSSVDNCVKPKLDAHEAEINCLKTDVALLKNNWKIAVGVTSVIVGFATWLANILLS